MSSHGVIDLRPGRNKKPPKGQTSLFAGRTPGNDVPPRRPLPLRARRRRARAAVVFGILLALAAVAYAIHYVSYLPLLSVGTVAVSGEQNVPPQLVSDYVQSILDDGSYHFLSRRNIFLYPAKVLERDIVADFPRINSAHVSRPGLFSTELDIAVTEREPFALWCSTQCYEMDEGGFIFAQTPSASSTGYIFSGGVATGTGPIGQFFASTHLPTLMALLTRLGQSGFTPQGATVESDSDFFVPLAQGFALKASFGESPDQLIKNLQLVLASDALLGKESQLEYVDLRFGDRVYYKLKGQAEETSAPQ